MSSSAAGTIGSNSDLAASGGSSVAVATASGADDASTPNGTWCLGLPGTRFGSAIGVGSTRTDTVWLMRFGCGTRFGRSLAVRVAFFSSAGAAVETTSVCSAGVSGG
jgi:hypothetical protein